VTDFLTFVIETAERQEQSDIGVLRWDAERLRRLVMEWEGRDELPVVQPVYVAEEISMEVMRLR
jgi:hypothetical protein